MQLARAPVDQRPPGLLMAELAGLRTMMPTMTRAALCDEVAPGGVLRAAINLGNPVLTRGTSENPRGLPVQLATGLAEWLDVRLILDCYSSARETYAAMARGDDDVCFLADVAQRREHLTFTDPYLELEGVFAARPLRGMGDAGDIDHAGVTIAVRKGSAYDLFLSSSIKSAELVRAHDEVSLFEQRQLDVLAGIREPVEAYASEAGLTVLAPPFMQIHQAVGLPRTVSTNALTAIAAWLRQTRSSPPIRQELRRLRVLP